jgi:hypothetical protein
MHNATVESDARFLDDLVLPIEGDCGVFRADASQERSDISGIHLTGVYGHPAGEVGRADDGYALMDDGFARPS